MPDAVRRWTAPAHPGPSDPDCAPVQGCGGLIPGRGRFSSTDMSSTRSLITIPPPPLHIPFGCHGSQGACSDTHNRTYRRTARRPSARPPDSPAMRTATYSVAADATDKLLAYSAIPQWPGRPRTRSATISRRRTSISASLVRSLRKAAPDQPTITLGCW
jgi:hypothetical protein